MNARIGFVQFKPVWGNAEKNLVAIEGLVKKGSVADLLILPELCLTGYAIKNRADLQRLADAQDKSDWVNRLTRLAKERECALLVGFLERTGKKFFDSAAFITPRGITAICRKTHLFFREKEWFTPGNLGTALVQWRGVRYGIGICLDYLFPEYWRALALQNADVFCLPANLVTDNGQPLMNARSRENRVFSVVANRLGTEKGIRFCGNSQVISPKGKILAESRKNQKMRVVKIDVSEARNKFLLEKNQRYYNHVLNDRRPEVYGAVLS